ncbi:MAG: radical SAM protein [Nitrospirota bacterium]
MIENNHTSGNLSKMIRFYSTILWRNIHRGKLPYKAHLILSWKCQSRCVMCDIWKRKPGNEFTLEEWQKFFKRNPFLKWLTFTGGEPFLRDDLVEIVEAAAHHCTNLYLINTPTNALSPDKILKKVEGILKLGIPKYVLSISLDGPPEVHDRVRGIPGTWESAMEVLQGAKEIQKSHPEKFNVVLEYTLLPESHGRFAEMVDALRKYAPEINAGDFFLATPNISEHYYGNTHLSESLRSKKCRPLIESSLPQIQKVRQVNGKVEPGYIIPQLFIDMAASYLRTDIPLMRCRATRSTIFIDPEGTVYPCNGWNKVLGHLREADFSLRKILEGPAITEIRQDMDQFKCGGCWTPCEAFVSIAEEVIRPKTILRLLGVLSRRR